MFFFGMKLFSLVRKKMSQDYAALFLANHKNYSFETCIEAFFWPFCSCCCIVDGFCRAIKSEYEGFCSRRTNGKKCLISNCWEMSVILKYSINRLFVCFPCNLNYITAINCFCFIPWTVKKAVTKFPVVISVLQW